MNRLLTQNKHKLPWYHHSNRQEHSGKWSLLKKKLNNNNKSASLSLEITAEKRVSPLGLFSGGCRAALLHVNHGQKLTNQTLSGGFCFPYCCFQDRERLLDQDGWRGHEFRALQQPLQRHGGEAPISRGDWSVATE